MASEFDAVRQGLTGYDLGAPLGRGAFGVVLAGVQSQLGRKVAIKSLLSEHAYRPEVRARFATEAKVLSQFQHPHIVSVFDYREGDDYCALVMELLEGGSLRERLGPPPFSPITSCATVMTVCSALEYAHRHGVLHRDIKPANLMFTADGTLKLTDFGIAKVVSAGGQPTMAGTFMGTPNYMAPEQIDGATPGPGVDVYGAATLLYELLCGTLPFSPEGPPLAVAHRHLYSEPTHLRDAAPGIPPEISMVVMRGLERDPTERFRTAEDFGVAIATASYHAHGPGWLSRSQVKLLAPGAILEAATGHPTTTSGAGRETFPLAGTGAAQPNPSDATGYYRAPAAPAEGDAEGDAPLSNDTEEPGFIFTDLQQEPPGEVAHHHPPPPPPPPPETRYFPSTKPPKRPSSRRWILVVVVVFAVLLALAGAFGVIRAATSDAETSITSESATTVTCWDGASSDSLDDCSEPTGEDRLRWMFPAISDEDCEAEPDMHQGSFKCFFDFDGEEGFVRYGNREDVETAYNNYIRSFGADPVAWEVDGESIGYKWRSQALLDTEEGWYYKAARIYEDFPLSFAVFANSQDAVQHALDDVVVARPPWELRGVEDG